MFTAAVCCCWWGAPGTPFGHLLPGGEIDSKGQRGKEERDWEHGVDPAPTGRSPVAGHRTWARQGWEEDSPAGSAAGAGVRRLRQQMGLAGAAVNSSAWGKL